MQVVAGPIKFYVTSFALRIVVKNCPLGHRKTSRHILFRVCCHYEKGLFKILTTASTNQRATIKKFSLFKNLPGSLMIIFRNGVVVTPLSIDLLCIALRQFSRSKIAKAHALRQKTNKTKTELCHLDYQALRGDFFVCHVTRAQN